MAQGLEGPAAGAFHPLTTLQLTKLETAFDQVRKAHPKLKPADAALLASALTLTGRHALAIYDEKHYRWPDDYEKLTASMVGEIKSIQESTETTVKRTKTSPEEEPIGVNIGLAPHLAAGENVLVGRNDLKTLLSDVLKDGVEFVYAASDIGWQWAMDRANWGTISGNEIGRRVRVKAAFTEGAVGVEMGVGGPKKRASKPKAPPVEKPEEPAPEEESTEE